MLLSRVAGLARQTIFSSVFGLSLEADVFQAALRIPNFLQNLFGDGVLSASMIPVYARLVKAKGQEDADRVARAVLALLAVTISVIVLLGVLFTPMVVDLVATGFRSDPYKRNLTITLVRIMFPGVGLLVGSAWCLAILNTHGKFFNSYAAPTLWNAAIIVGLLWFPGHDPSKVAIGAAWGSVVGSVLQLLAQLPQVMRVMSSGWRTTRFTVTPDVREVLTMAGPVILSRGAIQVSAFIDAWIASFLGNGPMAALANAQSLYMFPVSMFGMAVASASLPAMSSVDHSKGSRALIDHLINGQRLLLVLMVPSVMGFLAFGDVMSGVVFEHGKFTHDNSRFVWFILAGSAVGLIATTIGRFYASAFYALGDSKTPARFAFIRIALVIGLGVAMAFGGPWLFGVDLRWGTVGLTLSAGMAGWVEFALLRRALRRLISDFNVPAGFLLKCWAAAIVAAALATGLRWALPESLGLIRYLTILFVFGSLYLAGAVAVGTITITELRRRLKI